MQHFLKILVFFLIPVGLMGQGELNEDGLDNSSNESTFSINFNSNGWGVAYRYAKRLDGFNKRFFEFDYVGIKHPKEIKSYNEINSAQKRFVYGKINQFSTLRIGFGKQKEIFSKTDKGGIAIRYYYSFGVNVGFLKPIYYEVAYPYPNDYRLYYLVVEKYNFYEQHSEGFVYGKASYFEGFGEMKIKPGGFIKLGSSFDFSTEKNKIRSVEAGFILDVFADVVPIMATRSNFQLFPSFFVSYRFGKTYSPRLKNME
ncbi:MAG: hypothetical protein JXR58_04315 [Bacteroidales bacterium]|nr:hypothetical protein [Bacteroidales bacterium]